MHCGGGGDGGVGDTEELGAEIFSEKAVCGLPKGSKRRQEAGEGGAGRPEAREENPQGRRQFGRTSRRH